MKVVSPFSCKGLTFSRRVDHDIGGCDEFLESVVTSGGMLKRYTAMLLSLSCILRCHLMAQWAPIDLPYGGSMGFIGTSGSTLFTGMSYLGVFRSTDGGASWNLAGAGLPRTEFYCFQASENSALLGTFNGLYRSTDGGTSWSSMNLGVDLPESNVTSFAATGTCVLASTYSGRLFLSTNGGDLWLPVNRGFPNTQIAFIAVNGSYVFANTLAGLYRNLFSDLMSQLPWQEGPSPGQFTLLQNYPNPFNNSTTIRYYLPYATTVSLRLFNPMGQLVTTLVDETQEAGYHSTHVDGAHLASGVYFCQFKAGGEARVKRLVLVK